jgi:hypothetical protein
VESIAEVEADKLAPPVSNAEAGLNAAADPSARIKKRGSKRRIL